MFHDICKWYVMKKNISPAQLRAARALVDWSREALAASSGTTVRTLARIESGETEPRLSTVSVIRSALEAAGVEFTNGDAPGVRLRRPGPPRATEAPADTLAAPPAPQARRSVGPEDEDRAGPEAPKD